MPRILTVLPVLVLDAWVILAMRRHFEGTARFGWVASPAVAWTVMILGPVMNFYLLTEFLGVDRAWAEKGLFGAFVLITFMVFFVASIIPLGWLGVVCVGDSVADIVTTGGSSGVRNRPTCDQADRAARAHRHGEAEILYREALGAAQRTARDPFRVPKGWAGVFLKPAAWSARLVFSRRVLRGPEAPLRLAFGNFLRDRGRRMEAAEQWAEASRGDLPEEQAIMAAARAADAYWEERRDRQTADGILADIIARYPHAPENASLAAKRAAMRGAAGGS